MANSKSSPFTLLFSNSLLMIDLISCLEKLWAIVVGNTFSGNKRSVFFLLPNWDFRSFIYKVFCRLDGNPFYGFLKLQFFILQGLSDPNNLKKNNSQQGNKNKNSYYWKNFFHSDKFKLHGRKIAIAAIFLWFFN